MFKRERGPGMEGGREVITLHHAIGGLPRRATVSVM